MNGPAVGGLDDRRAPGHGPVAVHPLAPGDQAVGQLACSELARFRAEGIYLEIVRARPNCLVVRSSYRSPAIVHRGRARVTEWLESLPRLAHHEAGTVIESTSNGPEGPRCIHTLLWNTDPVDTPVVQPSESAGRLEPAARGMALPAPPSLPPHLARPGGPPGGAGSGSPDGARPMPPDGARPMPPDGARPMPAGDGVPLPPGFLPAAVGGRLPVAHTVARPVPVPAPSRPPVVPEAPTVQRSPSTPPPPAAPRPTRPTGRNRRWAWARRRGWMVVVGLLAGAMGGLLAGGHGGTSYAASTVLVVQSGASPSGPGSADDAEELAITYAALIPDDRQLQHGVADALGTTPSAVAGAVSVEAESGTSLLDVRYTASSPAVAVKGANQVAHLLSSTVPPGHAIAAGSVAVVSPAATAARSGSLHKYGLPLGVLLGLVVGLGAALVAERVDRRVDDLAALTEGAGCPGTVVPGGLSAAELVMALEREADGPITVVPLRPAQALVAGDLARALSAAWPVGAGVPAAQAGPAFVEAPGSLGDGDGSTVIVVAPGERLSLVHEAAERLRLVGRDPAWAVLDMGVPAGRGRGR